MKEPSFSTHKERTSIRTVFDIFMVSTKLGLTSFGGPIAHLGYFHEEYVRRRKWLDVIQK